MARGFDQVLALLLDSVKYTCGFVISPLTYVMTMRFVASAPVGAPFAMSTLGAGARSLRAPARPSIVGRPVFGSVTPGSVTGPGTGRGRDQLWPPFVDTDISSNAPLPCDGTVPTPNTYALPA